MAKHARGAGPATAVNRLTPADDRPTNASVTGPRHAASARRGRRRLVGIAACLVLAGAATGYLVVNGGPSRVTIDGAATEVPAAPTAPAESPAPTPPARSPTDQASALAAGTGTATGADRLPESLSSTAAGLTEPGIVLIASPAPDGSFDVDERIWLRQPVGTLTLRPGPIDRAGRGFVSASATATQVRLRAGDRPVAVPDDEIDRVSTLPVAEGDRFELRYRLTDVTVLSTPSSSGRALAAIGPLTGNVPDDLPVHFIVTGSTVLGLNCPLLAFGEQSCGSRLGTEPGFQHELPAQRALVTVQFDLPPG